MTATTGDAVTVPDRRAYRMTSIDLLRGLVIVVMALDHVRDSVMVGSMQDPTADPSTGLLLFATRWVTHFCAPTFVFLAGVSAGLMAQRKSPSSLARFLVVRGLWLIVLEVLVVSTAASFAPLGIAELGGRTYVGLQVIWAIGASMVVLAGAQFLGRRAASPSGPRSYSATISWTGYGRLGRQPPRRTSVGGTPCAPGLCGGPVLGLFLLSLASVDWRHARRLRVGQTFQEPPRLRDARLTRIGIGLVIGFALLRALDLYGDHHKWHFDPNSVAATLMSFLATTKYPPSLLYLLMTLGPAAIVCAFAERWHGGIKNVLVTFGRAPLAFYVAHLYLIHAVALLLGIAQGFAAQQFLTHYRYFPKGYGVSLGAVYLIWIAVVATLYPLCRWVASVKARRTDWWLSYV
jgi:uncharacterized membrane protein